MCKRGCHISGEVIGPNRIRVLTVNGRESSDKPEMDIVTKAKSGKVSGRVTYEGRGREAKHLVLKEDK